MRTWYCRLCFGDYNGIERGGSAKGGKDSEYCNPVAEKLGLEEGEKEEEDGEQGLELGFYFGLLSGERRVTG